MVIEFLSMVGVPIVVALLSSAGIWRFFQARTEQEHERRSEFRRTLQGQIDTLSEQVGKLNYQKESLLREIGELREALAEAKTTILHLQELLRRQPYDNH